ncbi:hypothetical protein HYN48_12290 [Flavobacterium magnum]|uniref:Sel1 repeat family protein n=2 Tax=Flavobacterium magnum TaxID=2162713 RepID=A0A2S0RGP6_9FLAO|nr:hypothetical protein HYN48_12290 [Flavobacterium magnum]
MRTAVLILLMLLSCPAFAQKEILYTQRQFDSDTCCWRELARSGRYLQGAALIAAYLKDGKPQRRQALYWHAGQLYALGGDNSMALRYFGKTTNILYRYLGDEDARMWYFYVNGVKAFLKRDRQKLLKIISIWKRKFLGNLNYNQLLLLSEHWDMRYAEALDLPKG